METGISSTGWLVPLFIGSIFGLLGVIFTVVAVIARRKAQAAQAWPTVRGQVLASGVREHSDYDSDEGTTSTSYEAAVEYAYAILGQEHQGKRVAFGANRFDRRKAEEIVARYPAGAAVQVHYDPHKPGDAVLEVRAAGMKLFLILGIAFLLIAVMAGMIALAGLIAA